MEKPISIYISIPLTVPLNGVGSIVNCVRDLINGYDKPVEISRYTRGDFYNSKQLEESDIFIFRHPENKFSFNSKFLSKGVRKELQYAIDNKKKILLSYLTTSEERIYEVNIKEDIYSYSKDTLEYHIEGITGYINQILMKVILNKIKPTVLSSSNDQVFSEELQQQLDKVKLLSLLIRP